MGDFLLRQSLQYWAMQSMIMRRLAIIIIIIIISPHLQNPRACPSSILLLDRGKFNAAAFTMMLVDCCVRQVLI